MSIRVVCPDSRRVVFIVLIFLLITSIANLVSAAQEKHRLGDIPLSKKAYEKLLKKIPLDMMATIEAALPPDYDARDEGIVTPAKDQGYCGSCWAFASVGALESHLLILGTDTLDLSEQQQVSCNTDMYGCEGGYSTAIQYWEGKGPEDEDDFPYQAKDTSDGVLCVESSLLEYHVVDFHTVDKTTAAFKASLIDDGPSYWSFLVYSDFDDYWDNADEGTVYVNKRGSRLRGGHAVLLIGWDDTKGAFLCKNSWSDGPGIPADKSGPNGDGTFWIAYTGHYRNLQFGMANFQVVGTSDPCAGVTCDDNGLFCDGEEVCSSGVCIHTGNPCNAGEVCNEDTDSCDNIVPLCLEKGEPCVSGDECCSGLCHPVKGYCK